MAIPYLITGNISAGLLATWRRETRNANIDARETPIGKTCKPRSFFDYPTSSVEGENHVRKKKSKEKKQKRENKKEI